MKRTWFRILLLSIAFVLASEHVHAQGMRLNGIGGRVGYFDPEQTSGTVGFGGHLNFTAGKLALLPTVEYWSKSKNSVDFSQWSFAADLHYHYTSGGIDPFVGLGIAVLMSDTNIGDSSTNLGLDVMGGVQIPLNESLALSGEVKFVVAELHSVRLNAGLTYFFAK